jgi:Zn-dependent protease with chaperone function
MGKNKIKEFQLTENKKIKLQYFGPFLANSRIPPQKIAVDEYFYKLSEKEQRAVIWHELYHRKNSTGLKRIWWALRSIFTKENTRWTEEFRADEYSTKMCGKKDVLKLLNSDKRLYSSGIVEYDPKTHPKIEDRIKNIQRLK